MNYFSLLDELSIYYIISIRSSAKREWSVEIQNINSHEYDYYAEAESLQELIRGAYNYAFPIPKNTYCQYCALKACACACECV